MIYAIVAGLIMVLAAVIVALVYRGKAHAEQHHAAMQKQRAEAAEAINNHRQQLDTALETLQHTHREETLHANDPHHFAARSDFDNDWADASGLHGTESAADHSSRATVAASAGAAGHHIDRDDVLGR